MFKKKFAVIALILAMLVVPGQAFAKKDATVESGKPTKTEYISSENGKVVPVLYFDSAEDIQLYQEKRSEELNLQYSKAQQDQSQISPMAVSDFTYNGYVGVLPFDYQYVYTQNKTQQTQKWTRTVSRTSSSKTNVTVGTDFAKAFKAEVGVEWANSTTFTDTFEVNIPKMKQAEIWSWNNAKWYNWTWKNCGFWSCTNVNFSATRPTDNFGYEIYILDFRDPE